VNSTLQELNLGWNDVGDDGALAIANALRVNSTLRVLDLFWNIIGNDGTRAIADSLRVNRMLQTLYLESEDIVNKDAKKAVRESWGDRAGTLKI